MSDPGPAQLDLIRRYARTMRELHADAMATRGPRIGAREARDRVTPGDAPPKAGHPRPGGRPEVPRSAGAPTLPAS
jgi:hypothetical protein